MRKPHLTVLFFTAAFIFFQCEVSARMLQNLPDLPGESHKPVRKVNRKAPCAFEREYQRIKSQKSDPRVAFIELFPVVHAGEATDFDFESLCKCITQQREDNVTVLDRTNGYLQIFWDDEQVNDAIAYFSGPAGSPGVILYVTRSLDSWRAFVFIYRDKKWQDVTARYLGQFNLSEKDYIVAPQYGRTARVITFDDKTNRFHHKLWLTWDGTKFNASSAKKMPGWHCPDTYYRYFGPAEYRQQYCQ